MLQIAQNLRLIREEALEISRTQFAEYLNIDGLTANILQNIESERTIPKASLVRELAKRIGITENDLKNKRLTKKDVPVIVIEKTQASTVPAIVDVLQKQLEQQRVQIDQQQKVIEHLMQQLKDA